MRALFAPWGCSRNEWQVPWFYLVWLALFLNPGAYAATVAVVLSDDTAPYQETAAVIENRLGTEHTVVKILASRFDENEAALSSAKQIVSIGVTATRKLAERRTRTPVLAILIPRAWYQSEGKAALLNGGRTSSFIFIDQPLTRQFHLINSALPTVSKVGVVLGKQAADQLPELDRQAKGHRVALSSAILDSSSRLVDTLERVLEDAEVLLLAFPDSEVLTRTSAQSIFMTSYRYRDPVVGYSQSLAKAGALLAVYSTPEQIGQQAAEVLERALSGERLPSVMWPKYFSVAVNEYVARSLDIPVLSEAALLKRVQDAEAHD